MRARTSIAALAVLVALVAEGVARDRGAAVTAVDGRVQPGVTATPRPMTVLYSAVGAELTQYDIDSHRATLTRRSSVRLPANVQEAVLHPSRRHLYVGWSNTGASYGTGGASGQTGNHGLTAFRVDATSGELAVDGEPTPLRARPIHLTTDGTGSHVLVAYNNPSGVTVHRIQPGGTIGAEVKQPSTLDVGIYAHQVRVLPSNRAVVLVTRGNAPTDATREDPGALKLFAFKDGELTNLGAIAPADGYGFQARHLDFHPTRPWAFLTLERQNRVEVFRVTEDALEPSSLFSRTTLADVSNVRPGQTTSTIHVHPNGRYVYVGNRASATTDFRGARVSLGGENTIAVFTINQDTGEPTLIQTIDTRGFHPRTFALDASGGMLIAGNLSPLAVRDGDRVRTVPAGMALFRIGVDGKLEFARQYAIDSDPSSGRSLFWIGTVPLG